MSVHQLGPKTLPVPMTLFSDNRKKVIEEIRKHPKVDSKAIVLLQGGDDIPNYNTDTNYLFRQESFFYYLFGVTEPGFYGTIDIETGKATLFALRLPQDYATWMGKLKSAEDYKKFYEVDAVCWVDEIDKVISAKSPSLLLTVSGKNADSGLTLQPANFEGIEKFVVNCDIIYPIIAECRVIKSPMEQDILRYVCKVSSDAHKLVMKSIRPGWFEYQAEALFLHHCYFEGGCRHASYTCICGAGDDSSILHYGHAAAPNNHVIKDGDMCLFDMGGNYFGYAADITCSFPVNGKFTEDQKIIYNAVLAANDAVMRTAKEGVNWVDMHVLANRVLLEKLRDANIIKGEIDDMMSAGLNKVFQPHGLGHLIGLDVHDVGGYGENYPPRPTMVGVTSLRFARNLLAGMYITIEPGCYFIDHLLDMALSDPALSKFLVPEAIQRFRGSGGVRIEDDVLVTKDGCENFTVVPRTVEEIEAYMASN